jgi:hypothetical protein
MLLGHLPGGHHAGEVSATIVAGPGELARTSARGSVPGGGLG